LGDDQSSHKRDLAMSDNGSPTNDLVFLMATTSLEKTVKIVCTKLVPFEFVGTLNLICGPTSTKAALRNKSLVKLPL